MSVFYKSSLTEVCIGTSILASMQHFCPLCWHVHSCEYAAFLSPFVQVTYDATPPAKDSQTGGTDTSPDSSFHVSEQV